MNTRIKKIQSGGQPGADRAALDVALKFGIPHGGWIPEYSWPHNRILIFTSFLRLQKDSPVTTLLGVKGLSIVVLQYFTNS